MLSQFVFIQFAISYIPGNTDHFLQNTKLHSVFYTF
jgi:hypothetical protein